MPGTAPRHHLGFTLLELITVMIMLGVLAVVALPRLDGAGMFRDAAFREQVLSALRMAQKSAVSRRRLVCAAVAGDSVTLTTADGFPATTCGAGNTLAGPSGDAAYARAPANAAAAVASPTTTLFFQPSGRVTSDGGGATATNFTIVVGDLPAIVVQGETGHVE